MIGTGTQRSLAATAADEPPPPDPAPVVAPAPRPRRWWPLLVAIAGSIAVIAIVRLLMPIGPDAPPAQPVAVVTVDARPVDAVAIDAAVDALEIDAAVAIVVDAGSRTRVRPVATTVDAAPAPVVAPRTVTINATPWAYFTVDGDPTQHETPKSLQLAPGKHRVQFRNPVLEIERTVTIDVPTDRDLKHIETLAP